MTFHGRCVGGGGMDFFWNCIISTSQPSQNFSLGWNLLSNQALSKSKAVWTKHQITTQQLTVHCERADNNQPMWWGCPLSVVYTLWTLIFLAPIGLLTTKAVCCIWSVYHERVIHFDRYFPCVIFCGTTGTCNNKIWQKFNFSQTDLKILWLPLASWC